MIALMLFLFELPTTHWYLLGISVLFWIALVFWELRARTPFLDLRMLASNRALTRTYVRFGLANLCLYVVMYGITEWIEAARGLSETQAGLITLPMTLASGVIIASVSRLNRAIRDRFMPIPPCPGGRVVRDFQVIATVSRRSQNPSAAASTRFPSTDLPHDKVPLYESRSWCMTTDPTRQSDGSRTVKSSHRPPHGRYVASSEVTSSPQ